MSLETPDNRIFDWLGTDSRGVPYYLHVLNLVWSPEGPEYDMRIYRKVARELGAQPDYLRSLVRTYSWRYTLVGCVAVILLRSSEYAPDLAYSLRSPNFVSPQIAMTLGIVCPGDAVVCLETVLKNAESDSDEKKIVAAQAVLVRLGSEQATRFSRTRTYSRMSKSYDGSIGLSVVERQWEFWSKVEPVTAI
jgi:hypothetical protein